MSLNDPWLDEEVVRMPDGPPKTIAVTTEEGGIWMAFSEYKTCFTSTRYFVHSILFDNGMIWDTINGWRVDNRMSLSDLRTLQNLGKAD